MNKYLIILMTLILTLASFPLKAQTKIRPEILISAAASLRDVFTELGADFEKKNNVKLSFNFASSGELKTQIEYGAPVDVFAAASSADIEALEKKDLLAVNSRINFAKNILVLIQSNNSKIQIKTIEDLAKSEVKKIAMGNPVTVPAGRYAKETLTNFKSYDLLKEKLVFGENVRQVLDYVSKNEVDAGFVYSTDALVAKNVHKILEVPASYHDAIVYPVAMVKTTKNEKVAKEFIKFITNKSSEEIFKKYGFR